MIGQTISHTELTLCSLSKIREGRLGSDNTSPSLNLDLPTGRQGKGNEGMSSSAGTE